MNPGSLAIASALELPLGRFCGNLATRNGVGQIAHADGASAVGHHLLEAQAPRELQPRIGQVQNRFAVETCRRIEGQRNLFSGNGLDAVAHGELPPKFNFPSYL